MKKTIPNRYRKYFWDIAVENLDLQEKSDYIITRLLEFGNIEVLRWLKKTYSDKLINDVVKKSKVLSAKSANFYGYYFNIPVKEILCLQEGFQNKHKKIWNH